MVGKRLCGILVGWKINCWPVGGGVGKSMDFIWRIWTCPVVSRGDRGARIDWRIFLVNLLSLRLDTYDVIFFESLTDVGIFLKTFQLRSIWARSGTFWSGGRERRILRLHILISWKKKKITRLKMFHTEINAQSDQFWLKFNQFERAGVFYENSTFEFWVYFFDPLASIWTRLADFQIISVQVQFLLFGSGCGFCSIFHENPCFNLVLVQFRFS